MYILISGSPKPNKSNSLYFLNKIGEKLNDYKIFELKKDKYKEIIENIYKSECIVFAFPLYGDSPTSITLSFLDYIIDNNIDMKNKLVYVIINCGFREGQQNITASKIMKRWCEKVGAIYSGSLMIGAGEIVGKAKNKLISRNVLKNINKFSNKIKNNDKSEDLITTIDILNNKLYCYIANIFWNKKGRKNNLSKEELIAK